MICFALKPHLNGLRFKQALTDLLLLQPLNHLLQVVNPSLYLVIDLAYLFLERTDLQIILMLYLLNAWIRIPRHKRLDLRVKDYRLHLIPLDLAVDCKRVFEEAVSFD